MGLIELASGNSVWRGMDYYNAKKTKSVEKIGPYTYDGTVQGEQLYHVHIDKEHLPFMSPMADSISLRACR